MAITAAFCDSFKLEILEGVHQPGDVYKMALFQSSATLGSGTTAYSSSGEVSGSGYSAGGIALSGFAASLDGSTALLDWSDPTWPNATITARGALIYNASRGDAAVAVLDFGTDVSSTAGAFTVQLPAPTAGTAVVRIG